MTSVTVGSALGQVDAVAELGGAVVVFGAHGVTAFRGGAVVATDTAVRGFRPDSATVIPAADGNGRWLVAIAADGRPVRLAALAALEEVGPRYGVTSAVGVGAAGRGVALALADGVAVAERARVVRYPGRFTAVAGGASKLVFAAQNRVEVWDLVHTRVSAYAVTGVVWVGVTAGGAAVAASPSSVWVERGGALERRLATSAIRGIAVAGERVWVAVGDGLVVLDGTAAHVTRGARLGADAHLAPADDGGVWVASGGALAKVSLGGGGGGGDSADGWPASIAPIFARVCSRCHLPGGSADVDLSTAPAWRENRAAIRDRVVDRRDMPPPGIVLSDEDRRAIAAWVSPK